MSAPDHRAAAHTYLDRGFAPVGWVIIDGRKAAVSMKGQRYADYTVTHADIDRWHPRWQVGLAMCQRSGFWTLDFDCGQDRAAEFFAAFAGAAPTAAQQTGRGMHLVYRGTGNMGWPRDGVWGGDWLDVQVRSNGFIAAAPSIHPSGRRYRWLDDRMPQSPGTLLLAYRPERQPRRTGRGGRRGDGLNSDLAHYAEHGIPAGWQDYELHRLACTHVRSMDHRELFEWLWAALCKSPQNLTNPWRPEDVWSKIARAAEFTSAEDAVTAKTYRKMLEALG